MKVLNIRGIDETVARDFSASASVRGMTQAEYLARLMELHRLVRELNWQTEDPEKPSWDLPYPEGFVRALGRHLAESGMFWVTS